MISLEKFKKALGQDLIKKLSEEEILMIQKQQDQEAEVYFAMWLENIKNKNNV